ncbi:hypothetical protein J5N97_013801 [Dioscorea zingiberensis]|uniref:Uncharacterized protein n=1 Tax=Dioscorea zingiberensis TaxID=325984 RepID=A0A9D5CTN2_9LILI|nr:hypothetical protein J5N97_013801 [Dioscorea zingiberensis]
MDSDKLIGPIVGQQYCLSCPIDLAFTKTVAGVKHGKLAVTDVNGNILFWLDASCWKSKRMLLDAASGLPLLSITQRFWSAHDRWDAFRGDSKDEKDLLFSVKRKSMLPFQTELQVFLATNVKENECDFKIKGEFNKRSSIIYKGNTSTVVAQMNKEHKVVNVPLEKHAFGVSIDANVDFAFITGLLFILHQLYGEEVTVLAAAVGTSAGNGAVYSVMME